MTSIEKLELAREILKKRASIFSRLTFQKLYPFTTENIAGYIDCFDLEDKSLLTVGSSTDQVFNAGLKGCREITVLDLCPFTEDYYYLKKAAQSKLTPEQFLSFLGYQGNMNEFFYRVLDAIEEEDSFTFWKKLQEEHPYQLRDRLFIKDEEQAHIVRKLNPYLLNKANYYETRERMKEVKPNFVIGNIEDEKLGRSFDNIFLSNVFKREAEESVRKASNNMVAHLNEEGKILLYYLYDLLGTSADSENYRFLEPHRRKLRQLPRNISIELFEGISNLEENSGMEDGIVVYQKKKH